MTLFSRVMEGITSRSAKSCTSSQYFLRQSVTLHFSPFTSWPTIACFLTTVATCKINGLYNGIDGIYSQEALLKWREKNNNSQTHHPFFPFEWCFITNNCWIVMWRLCSSPWWGLRPCSGECHYQPDDKHCRGKSPRRPPEDTTATSWFLLHVNDTNTKSPPFLMIYIAITLPKTSEQDLFAYKEPFNAAVLWLVYKRNIRLGCQLAHHAHLQTGAQSFIFCFSITHSLTFEPYRSHMFMVKWAAVLTMTPVVAHCRTQFSIVRVPWRTPDTSKQREQCYSMEYPLYSMQSANVVLWVPSMCPIRLQEERSETTCKFLTKNKKLKFSSS